MTTTTIHPLISEADGYQAWAGTGPNADAIYNCEDYDLKYDFRCAVSDALWATHGDLSAEAVETIAAEILDR